MFCFKFWGNCFDSRKTKLGDINFRQFMTIKVHLRLVFAYILLCPFIPPRNMQGSSQSDPSDAPCLKQHTLVSLHVLPACHNFCLSCSWYSYFPLGFLSTTVFLASLLLSWDFDLPISIFYFYFLLKWGFIFPTSQLLIWCGPWPPYF